MRTRARRGAQGGRGGTQGAQWDTVCPAPHEAHRSSETRVQWPFHATNPFRHGLDPTFWG